MNEIKTVLDAIASTGAYAFRLDGVAVENVREDVAPRTFSLAGESVPPGAYTIAKFEVLIPGAAGAS